MGDCTNHPHSWEEKLAKIEHLSHAISQAMVMLFSHTYIHVKALASMRHKKGDVIEG